MRKLATKEQLIERIKQMPDMPIIVADDDCAVYSCLYSDLLEDFVRVEKVKGLL